MSNSNTPFMMDEQELLRPSNEENSSNQHLVLHESPSTSTQEPLGITIHYPATSNTMASSTNIVRELQEKNGNMAEQSTIIIEPMEVMDSIDMHTIESNSHQRDKKNASIIPAYEFKTTSSNIVENVSESEKIGGTILSYPPSNKVPSINLLSKISRKSSIGGSVPYTITMVSDKTKEQPHRIFEQSSLENSLEKNNSNKTFHTKKIKLNLSDFNDLPKKKIKEEGKFEEYSAGYHGNSKAKVPGPGTIARLAPNATLIDLNKIKRDKQNNIPLLIDQVTVMIDDTNNVKFMDYGPSARKDSLSFKSKVSIKKESSDSFFGQNNDRKCSSSANKHKNLDFDEMHLSDAAEPPHSLFEDSSLSISLEQMRELRVDCNVALVDTTQEHVVYAHRVVLISRSAYFYRNLYMRRKKLNILHEFCRFTLPYQLKFDAVEAVVAFMYSGSSSLLWGCKAGVHNVLRVLRTFEMTETAETFAADLSAQEASIGLIEENPNIIVGDDLAEPNNELMLPPFYDTPAVEEITVEERKKKKKSLTEGAPNQSAGDNNGYSSLVPFPQEETIRLKSSVQKIVDGALHPFISKLEELFDPNNSAIQPSRSPHHIALWNADLLLTKLFDQNELTKYFTDLMNEMSESAIFNEENVSSPSGNYRVLFLTDVTGLDENYTKIGTSDSVVPEVETLTVGDMQIINYSQMEAKHINKYVRLIALYKYRISTKETVDQEKNKGTALGSLLEEVTQSIVRGLDVTDTLVESNQPTNIAAKFSIKQVSKDLSKRAIADLDARLNVSYQEEMIMHIIMEQKDDDNILPLSMGLFLAKGCSFCRKRECRSEDLTTPIGPDNPVCPDRQCILKNLVCNICNKQMANSKSLARHKYSVHDMQTGENTGMFICSHCGDTFSKKWKLNVHEKQHEDRKLQVACPICAKVMKGAIALKKHINMVHETKRQYSCENCHKMFKRKETLQVHYRIHTGEKPFACSHCEYSSETKGNLKAHTWRKHKLTLLGTTTTDRGMVQTSITGPPQGNEEVINGSVVDNINTNPGVLETPVLEWP